jgi:hypothetical protein
MRRCLTFVVSAVLGLAMLTPAAAGSSVVAAHAQPNGNSACC